MQEALTETPQHETTKVNIYSRAFKSIALLAYSGILLAATARHTFWHDEAQAWLIARSSSSIPNLFKNLRYEGHPPLWHLILYLITRFTWNVEWMKVPNYVSAIIAAALILHAKRPNIVIRLALVFSYYMVFEYGLIARNYMIGIALLLGAITFINRERTANIPATILLSLAALTSLAALIVAVCVFALVLNHIVIAPDHRSREFDRQVPRLTRLVAAGLFSASVLASLAIIRPPADSGVWLEGLHRIPNILGRFFLSGAWLGLGYLALPNWKHDFWEARGWSFPTLSLMAAFGYSAVFGFSSYLRNRSVRWFYLGATLCLLAVLIVTVEDAQRHLGWLYVVFMCSLLLDDKPPIERGDQQKFNISIPGAMVAVTLICQVAVGIFALETAFRYAFSPSKAVANFLQSEQLDQATIVASPFYTSEAIIAYLQRPYAYDIVRHRNVSFAIWNRQEVLGGRSLPDPKTLQELGEIGNPVILITEFPLTSAEKIGLDIKPLAAFTDGICSPEKYYVYAFPAPLPAS